MKESTRIKNSPIVGKTNVLRVLPDPGNILAAHEDFVRTSYQLKICFSGPAQAW